MTDLDSELRNTLSSVTDAHIAAVHPATESMRADVLRRTHRRRIARAVATSLAVAGLAAGVALALPNDRRDEARLPVVGPEGEAVTETIPLGDEPGLADKIAVTSDGVYVAGNDRMHRIDPATGEVEALWEALPNDTCCLDLDGSGDILWRVVRAGEGDTAVEVLQRVDPATGEWLAGPAPAVSAGARPPDPLPQYVALGDASSWSWDGAEPRVALMDPATVEAIDSYELPGIPLWGATFGESMWLVLDPGGSQEIARIDRGVGVARTEEGPMRVPRCPGSVAADAKGLWVVDACAGELRWLDPNTLEEIDTAPLFPDSEPGSVRPQVYRAAAGLGSVWVIRPDVGQVLRFVVQGDELSQQPQAIEVGNDPADIVVGGGAVWVANLGDSSVTKITLGADEARTSEPTPQPPIVESPAPTSSDLGMRAEYQGLYPADNLEEALAACSSYSVDETFSDPHRVASAFAREMLGWEGTTTIEKEEHSSEAARLGEGPPPELTVISVSNPAIEDSEVYVAAQEFRPDCWLVVSVDLPRNYETKEPTNLGISVRGRVVELGWAGYDAASFDVLVEYNGVGGAAGHGLTETHARLTLDGEPDDTGHFLILFRNAAGEVTGARGSGLPPGDFTAG